MEKGLVEFGLGETSGKSKIPYDVFTSLQCSRVLAASVRIHVVYFAMAWVLSGESNLAQKRSLLINRRQQ